MSEGRDGASCCNYCGCIPRHTTVAILSPSSPSGGKGDNKHVHSSHEEPWGSEMDGGCSTSVQGYSLLELRSPQARESNGLD